MTPLRSRVFAGEIVHLRLPTAVSWAATVWSWLETELGAPRTAPMGLTNEAWLERLGELRAELHGSGWRGPVRAVVEELGLDPACCAVDRPRLRAVVPGAERIPAARAAYFTHRDTWYGNPANQLNLWLALHPVDSGGGVLFYPEGFGQAVPNDSRTFEAARWLRSGGFQVPGVARAFPRCDRPPGPARGVAVTAGDLLVFSAAQLHGTAPPTDRVRFSLDLRLVDLDEMAAGYGAPDPDNACRGSVVHTYERLT